MAALLRGAVDRLPPDLRQRIRLNLSANGLGEWDPAMLERVIGNLVSNALKSSQDDTPIDVILTAGR
jgi:signal transduction histidine kinase